MKKVKKKKLPHIPKLESLNQINLNAGGIDIGCSEIWVCVPEDRSEKAVSCFSSFTCDLHKIAHWLIDCGVQTVAMESTGIYWIPLYDILEQNGIEVFLVNAQHVKNVAGRKTDILDCQWLQQLHTYGLLKASFHPDKEIRRLRDLNRHRDNLLAYRAAHIQHMQKAMHLMNIQLDNVITDITGTTGMKIMRDIIAGQRNPQILAQHRNPNCKNSQEIIEKSLQGTYSDEYVFQLQQALELYDYYSQKINECDRKIEILFDVLPNKINPKEKPLPQTSKAYRRSKNEPGFDLRTHLYRICGVDLTAINGLKATTVYAVTSETGVDMSRWPTEKHFSSWLSLSPLNEKSGGKILKTKTKKSANRAAKALRQAAQSLERSDSYLGAYYRRMKTRLGAAKAITATAHKLARLIYIMLKEQKEYIDLGAEYYLKKNKERQINYLIKKANALGFYITPATNVS